MRAPYDQLRARAALSHGTWQRATDSLKDLGLVTWKDERVGRAMAKVYTITAEGQRHEAGLTAPTADSTAPVVGAVGAEMGSVDPSSSSSSSLGNPVTGKKKEEHAAVGAVGSVNCAHAAHDGARHEVAHVIGPVSDALRSVLEPLTRLLVRQAETVERLTLTVERVVDAIGSMHGLERCGCGKFKVEANGKFGVFKRCPAWKTCEHAQRSASSGRANAGWSDEQQQALDELRAPALEAS